METLQRRDQEDSTQYKTTITHKRREEQQNKTKTIKKYQTNKKQRIAVQS